MNFVQPIRDPNMVQNIAAYLKKQSERNYMMFLTGIYSGRRISDTLPLRVQDVRGKQYFSIRETKTKKGIMLEINPILKKELDNYIYNMEGTDYLFKSRQGENKPIDRTTAYYILNTAAKAFSLQCIGTHTLRKTFGYHHYKQYKDIAILMDIFNHSHPSITMRYIGINQESMNNSIKRFKIF
jgi:integrase